MQVKGIQYTPMFNIRRIMVCIKNTDDKMESKLFIVSFFVSIFVFNFQQYLETLIINYNE